MSEYIVDIADNPSFGGVLITCGEIVRCRDCKRFHTNTNGFDCPKLEPDGFCAWANRKEDGECEWEIVEAMKLPDGTELSAYETSCGARHTWWPEGLPNFCPSCGWKAVKR